MIKSVTRIPKLLWQRLPYIAGYTLLLYVMIVAAQQAFYRFMPSSYFLNYYSAEANSAEEHKAIPFKVCRTKRGGDHIIEGQRVFYKVPEGQSKSNGVQVKTIPIRGVAAAKECADLFISSSQFDHDEGYYYFRTVLEFEVNGYKKRAEFETNVYAVTPKRLNTVEDIQNKIDELQRQIDELKQQLNQAQAQVNTMPNQPQVATQITRQPQSAAQPTQQNQPVQANQPEPEPEDEGLIPDSIPIIGGLL